MLITVFTPTYNRAGTISRLFESLKQQDFQDFEWLIVDDGSTDNTSEIIESFQSTADFPIRYILKPNGGKHTAYNVGLDEAKGQLFFNVDSDDWLMPDSLGQISKISDKIFLNSNCGGIIALKSLADGAIIGNFFSKDDIYHTFRELELNGDGGERSIVFKTSIAKTLKFPYIEGERFMPESVVYDKFTDTNFYVLNKSLTVCEYLPDGLSSSPKKLMLKNPGGYVLYYKNRIDLAVKLTERIGYVLRYNYFRHIYKGRDVTSYQGKHLFLVTILKPLNFAVSLFYK